MTQQQNTLYGDLRHAGQVMDHHEGDLYVLDSEAAQTIIKLHKASFTSFVGNDGNKWLELPFSYTPFWMKP